MPWVAVEPAEDGVRARSAFLLVDVGDSYVCLGARALHDVSELAELRAEADGTLFRVDETAAVASGEPAGTYVR